jgi:protein-L-isoaspartate(D-aspartate) O-methyltransferase
MQFSTSRLKMVKEQLITRGIKDERLLAAMRKIPRHLFVPEALRSRAYGDHPLPIGEGQTISQPYVIALMVEALELQGTEKILEIGTGSGYQTAILAELAEKVYSIERIKFLALKARELIEKLGYINILIRIADGSYGWREEGPFDRIIVSAASPSIPDPLLGQLKDGGIMIVPLGNENSQTLVKVKKEGNKKRISTLSSCFFVKMIGQYGWKN